MALALPKHVTPERMARLALTEFRKTPALHKCKTESIIAAVFQASQLGLEFGGVMGQAYMVPFKDEATLIIGYRGYVELIRRSGQIINIQATAVFENDVFEYEQGLDPKLRHVPAKTNRGEITHFYSVAWFKNGQKSFIVMSREEVERIRDGSNGYQMAKRFNKSSPWDTHFEPMGQKTVIRRHSKQLPMSPEIQAAMERDDRREDEGAEPFIDVPFESIPDGEGRQVHPSTGEVLEDNENMPPTASAAPEAPGQTSLPLGGEDDGY
ncbi:recombination and repair protein RecT [compost metagenome]